MVSILFWLKLILNKCEASTSNGILLTQESSIVLNASVAKTKYKKEILSK